MHKYLFLFNFLALAAMGVPAHAASGEDIYKAKCSSCHDSGAGQAPRIAVRGDWSEREIRGRAAMIESAIKGIPATAMGAKGGYAELTDDEVRATVEYMLARAGFQDRAAPATAARATPAIAATGSATVDDTTLVERVAAALHQALAPGAVIDRYGGEATVRGVNIRVAARDGVVTLSGAVEKSDLIPRAQSIVRAVAGVRNVESRLVAAGMFDFD